MIQNLPPKGTRMEFKTAIKKASFPVPRPYRGKDRHNANSADGFFDRQDTSPPAIAR